MASLLYCMFIFLYLVSSVQSQVQDMGLMKQGRSVPVQNPNGNLVQYQTRRDFPIDGKKYCYTLSTQERRRYLVRATFQYGSLKSEDTYPKFELYLDTTMWSTVTIFEASRTYVNEMIIRASSNSVDVCVCCATTGFPFISTLELRPLNISMYATDYEDDFFLKVAARVNFGAPSTDVIRYPDDPYDRIWDSDLVKRQNYLVGVAPGTERINTSINVDTGSREYPPMKVMQTAVVGTKGTLSYRLNLDGFPANARAYAYFAEIEDLGANDSRKFRLEQPNLPEYNSAVVNIAENANGMYTLYEPSYMNVSLEFVLSFAFVKTSDSTRGPLLNAIEISKYVPIAAKTDRQDSAVLNILRLMSSESLSLDEGDPCVPTPWEWVNCSSIAPLRIVKIDLSGKNMKGEIPRELNNMQELTELWLAGNSFSGPFPDISNLINIKILHLENNKLTGALPSYLNSLSNLQELYIQNNSFSGEIPAGLLTGNVTFEYNDNPRLHKGEHKHKHVKLIIGISVGVLAVVTILILGGLLLLRGHREKSHEQKRYHKGDSLRASTKPSTVYSGSRGHLMEEGIACYITLSDLEEATNSFSKKIGKGSFGTVYYGRMKDGKEVAVKMMADSSTHMNKQFVTEIALLSRIHHRNLVPLIGYCEEEHQCILVYEYMHNGTLRDHLHGSTAPKHLDWLIRLRIAEDAAKGLEYLHTGCNPSIIHRDVKTSNILLDNNMRAKVSDFGLSRQAEEDLTHISSVARGTVGYLDPEYYANQQLTEKSDVYSFGVVLLELISGKKPVSPEDFGPELNIVHWAKSLIRKGDVVSIMDPFLEGNVKIESIWRIAEIAIQCVEQYGVSRPRMQEIIVAIQEAVKIEKGSEANQRISSGSSSKAQSSRKTLLTSFLEIESPDISKDCLTPSAR
ncbi:probable LRR receptor-like serine/threonine-protein kinase At1g67720 isoform X2 [Argentina anserina]|uniref:probable LRR receptor-like serine/threonine-protein kinase At1g67720 isoform X2 n=1 Tax=Argentina anserina TaxID=57926 RepID=UPI0021764BD9|nr:probable LRR receptor-like serine/threonine-protein kinase At1g67720 isoform X2 [Potentilla anserina]